MGTREASYVVEVRFQIKQINKIVLDYIGIFLKIHLIQGTCLLEVGHHTIFYHSSKKPKHEREA